MEEGPGIWAQLLAGLLGLLMLLFLAPRVKHAIQTSRKGSTGEWLHVIAILGVVALFVLLLIKLV